MSRRTNGRRTFVQSGNHSILVMGEKAITSTVSVIIAIIGVAIVAVIVSKQSNTASVIGAGGNALASVLKAAVSPVTGGGSAALPNLSTGF